jgi:GT2 family glycosyltransferase
MADAVAACVITYRRPEGLATLLGSLAAQSGAASADLAVVVVDNDPAMSAAPVVDAARGGGLSIDYQHEPLPGIPRARNRSVARALAGGTAYLCFLDDDEFAAPTWLARLVAHAESSRAAVVAGPVLSILPDDVPAWLKRGRVFSRRRYATGHRLARAATNNVLVHRAVFESVSPWFDESMPLSGGTDTDFFRRVHRAGFTIEWCDEAVVYEQVPRDRCTLRWIARRMLRGGLAFAAQARRYEGWPSVARNVGVGAARLTAAIFLSVLTLGLVPPLRLRIVENAGLGAGLVLGGFGITIDEYRRD